VQIMEDFKVAERVALPGLTAKPHGQPPGRSPDRAPPTKQPEKPKGHRLKQLLGRGEKTDDAGASEKPVSRPRLDPSVVLETLGVPAPLRVGSGCHALLARSLAAAYNALRDLSDDREWGGRNQDGSTTRPPPTPRYDPANFMPSSLSYQQLPLVGRNQWLAFLHALLFADERQARDLTDCGFGRTLAEIWNGGVAGGDPSNASAASNSPLDEMVDRMWQRIYQQPGRWRGKALPQIANAIYVHGYLGLDQQPPSGKQKASAADARYWKSLPAAMNVGARRQGDEFDPGEFYYLGDRVESTYRIYIHANHAVVDSVLGAVQAEMAKQKHPWCAKIASPVEAQFRPDTVVIYVTEPDPAHVQALAKKLDGVIAARNRIDSVPPLTTAVARGLSMAWDPECVDPDHSFGSFHAGILAEAFYDVVANMATPTRSALAATARLFFGMYGVDPDRPADRPSKLPDTSPPNMARFAGEDDGTQAALYELTQRSSDRAPRTSPMKNQQLRVQVMPTNANDVANAKRNLKQKPAVNKPHDT
jgi:type III HopA1-like effector protein